jgi:hypothetical protein
VPLNRKNIIQKHSVLKEHTIYLSLDVNVKMKVGEATIRNAG